MTTLVEGGVYLNRDSLVLSIFLLSRYVLNMCRGDKESGHEKKPLNIQTWHWRKALHTCYYAVDTRKRVFLVLLLGLCE